MNTRNLETKQLISIALKEMPIRDLSSRIGTNDAAIRWVMKQNNNVEFKFTVHMNLIRLVRKLLKTKEQKDD